jgi:hypothetical protein
METADTTFADVPEGMAAMAVMGSTGDTKYTWDPKNPDEVELAREHFDRMREKGFLVFKIKGRICKRKGKEVTSFNPRSKGYIYQAPIEAEEPEGELATEFDESADRYVATPAVAGG